MVWRTEATRRCWKACLTKGVRSVSASQTLGEKTHSEVEEEGETWKTDATLKSFRVNAENVRKLRCEFQEETSKGMSPIPDVHRQ